MPSADPGARAVRPADVERWLADLGLEPIERADREGIASWDLVLDGRRRFDLRVTLILDPSFALLVWAQFAPPINDMFRKSYRKLLRWNDEFPFAKFGLSEDERPLLAVELPIAAVDEDALGLALARVVGIADRLFLESVDWIWIGGKRPDQSARRSRNEPLLERYREQLAELADDPAAPTTTDDAPGSTAADAPADDDEPAAAAAASEPAEA
jgi:Putative bacterial sensory transduction regulator